MRYARLVIDNKSDKTDTLYTYGCEDESIRPGDKVYVHFGRGKEQKQAYVFDVSGESDIDADKLKYVEDVDENISLTKEMIRTCEWIHNRYLARRIDAVKLFLPAGAPLKSGKARKMPLDTEGERQKIEELTCEQKNAIENIRSGDGHGIYLIHGVTGSGKTEIYMRLIADALAAGKTAVMMVPEISLTKQIIDRFIGRFGRDDIAVLHSRLSPGERYDEWMRARRGDARIVIGARSAVFAPLENVGLFILDEEHETSYKSDQTPKYDTVEVAVKRAMDMDSKVVLGSATPSVVSYSRAKDGIYELIELKERYNNVRLPDIEVVDMRSELKAGNRSIFSARLAEEMEKNLADGRQIILFLNRRGYSTFVSCRSCGYVMKCPNCEISLTYHKRENAGICHYCGHVEPVPTACPECGSRYIKHFGTGTEKLEEETEKMFPGAKVKRLDLDSMRRKGSLEKIIDDFTSGKTDILTGTQVVAKGLDFKNVGLVGIISADASMNIPDYRSCERTFELITQAAGRAGRGDEEGKVIIQTYLPDNYAIRAAAKQDYDAFYTNEIEFRANRGYPPFGDFIQIVIGSGDERVAIAVADEWENNIRRILGGDSCNVLPHGRMTTAARDGYKECIMIKCPGKQRKRYMAMMKKLKEDAKSDKRRYSITVDVNPYSMWRE